MSNPTMWMLAGWQLGVPREAGRYEWFDVTATPGDAVVDYRKGGDDWDARSIWYRLAEDPVKPEIRSFESGATRNLDGAKLDFEGFLSPSALRRFAEYMHDHRKQKDGILRAADNWQKGIPLDVYLKSMLRHVMDLWLLHRGGYAENPDTGEPVTREEALCAVLFNAQGYLHEILKEK